MTQLSTAARAAGIAGLIRGHGGFPFRVVNVWTDTRTGDVTSVDVVQCDMRDQDAYPLLTGEVRTLTDLPNEDDWDVIRPATPADVVTRSTLLRTTHPATPATPATTTTTGENTMPATALNPLITRIPVVGDVVHFSPAGYDRDDFRTGIVEHVLTDSRGDGTSLLSFRIVGNVGNTRDLSVHRTTLTDGMPDGTNWVVVADQAAAPAVGPDDDAHILTPWAAARSAGIGGEIEFRNGSRYRVLSLDDDGRAVQTFSAHSGLVVDGHRADIASLNNSAAWRAWTATPTTPGGIDTAVTPRLAAVGDTVTLTGDVYGAPFTAVVTSARIDSDGDNSVECSNGRSFYQRGDGGTFPGHLVTIVPAAPAVDVDQAAAPVGFIPRTADAAKDALRALDLVGMSDTDVYTALRALAKFLPGSSAEAAGRKLAEERDLCHQYDRIVCPTLGWCARPGAYYDASGFTAAIEAAERDVTPSGRAAAIVGFATRYAPGGEVNQALIDHIESHLEAHKVPAANEVLESLGMVPVEVNRERTFYVEVEVVRTVEITVRQTVSVPVEATDDESARDLVDGDVIANHTDDYVWEDENGNEHYASTRWGSDLDDYDVTDVTDSES